MFGAMRFRVFAQERKSLLEVIRQGGIDGGRPERCLPRASAHDGKWRSQARMIWAQQEAAFRKIDAGIHRACNLPRVDVAGVWHYATQGRTWLLPRRDEGQHVRAQSIRIPRIETTGNGGMADSHKHLVGNHRIARNPCLALDRLLSRSSRAPSVGNCRPTAHATAYFSGCLGSIGY